MAVNYVAVEKKIPADREIPSKYYPQIVTTGEVTYRELAIEITKISPASTTDVMAVIARGGSFICSGKPGRHYPNQ